MENEELEVETNEVETNEVETDQDNPTYEDYIALKERLKKAESTLVDYKKKAKNIDTNGEILTKQDLEIVRFIDKNPEYEWKETEIKTLLKKWLDMKQVAKLIEPDKTLENRERTQSASISAWESWWSQAKYSIEELEKLSQKEYEKVMDLADKWQVVIE